jgi:hypothetical protein
MDTGNHAGSNVTYRHKYSFLGRDMSNVTYLFPNLLHDAVIKECVNKDKN